jgi:hypothetical protein
MNNNPRYELSPICNKYTEYRNILQEIIDTNKMTYAQDRKLFYDINITRWLLQQIPDSGGWIDLELGMYYQTTGGDQDKGLHYLTSSEKCGNIYSKNFIGEHYRNNDTMLAEKYFLEGYALGDCIFAPHSLGNIYPDVKWYLIAAENGHTPSMNIMSDIYMDEGDYKKSAEWRVKYENNYPVGNRSQYAKVYLQSLKIIEQLTRLASLDIGSLLYYDVIKYIR